MHCASKKGLLRYLLRVALLWVDKLRTFQTVFDSREPASRATGTQLNNEDVALGNMTALGSEDTKSGAYIYNRAAYYGNVVRCLTCPGRAFLVCWSRAAV
jgi:hypothetical protein